ncbi:polymerase [Paenibacillus yonginensis]|uniref:Polymerase n=1 Tax=Paenibacillus yonginensis TaxID=1462996 RepID=A0A1B1MXW8_9BACL|nr:FapA family protein [Paenibacillus yonginensis]ANS74024.1 polymerase [Paenibacillus yonginensis]
MKELADLEKLVNITISDDKMNAYLELFDTSSETNISEDQLLAFIKANGIHFGIQLENVQRIVRNPEDYSRSRTPIAFGEAPQDGVDGRIQYAFDLDSKGLRPLETEDGKVDYKEVTRLNNVTRGQLIATRVSSLPGRPGMDVTGQEVPFKPGKEARFKVGKNVVVTGEEEAMYAAIDGLVTLTDKGKINVFPVYEINGDVDYSIGNINFVGTVVVRGNVLTGFKIVASGDIRVTGGVEGAELEAGGSIEIAGGIIGYHKGLVKAGHHVKSSFIQDGNVEAGENVVVSQSIMHSNVRAGTGVHCSGAKGLIVGGHIQAGETVEARTIGNPMSTNTVIEVGVLPELRNELSQLREQLKELTASLDKTEKALVLLDQLASQGKLTNDKLAMRSKLILSKKSSMREQSELKERILDIEKTLEDTGKAKVKVIKTIYGGSKIVIGRYTKFIKDPITNMSFSYSDGDISMTANI